MIIGDRIRLRRIELNLSQDALANMLGCKDRSTVCKDEKRETMTTTKLTQYAKVLGVTETYLLGRATDDDLAKLNTDIVADFARDMSLQTLVGQFKLLNEEHQQNIIDQIEFLLAKERRN